MHAPCLRFAAVAFLRKNPRSNGDLLVRPTALLIELVNDVLRPLSSFFGLRKTRHKKNVREHTFRSTETLAVGVRVTAS